MKNLAILLILKYLASVHAEDDDSEEDTLFDSPCTAEEVTVMEDMLVQDLAKRVADQAYTTFGTMEEFKDEYDLFIEWTEASHWFVSHDVCRLFEPKLIIQRKLSKKPSLLAQILQNEVDFNSLLASLEGKEWLRAFKWYQNEILPKKKTLFTQMSPSYFENLHNRSEILPKLHKALKMILGGLVEMKDHGFDYYDNDQTFQFVKTYIDDSIAAVKMVLCSFTTFLEAVDDDVILPLMETEVPKITKENNGLLYRDTLNFLEYLSQVFQIIASDMIKFICQLRSSNGDSCPADMV